MNNNSYFSIRNEIGFALMLIGVQIGTAIRNAFGIELVNIIMATSVLCVLNFKNLFSIKMPSYNVFFSFLIIFQIIELLYASFCKKDISNLIPMHLYLMSIAIALSTQDKGKDFRYADVLFFYLGLFITIVVAYQATMGFTGIFTSNIFYREDIGTSQMEKGGDKITMGRAILFAVISSIVYTPRFKVEHVIRVICVIAAFVGLIMFNSRSPMVMSFMCLLVYMIKKSQLKSRVSFFSYRTFTKLFIYLLPVMVVLVITYLSVDYVAESIDNIFSSAIRGLLTLFGDKSMGVDLSADYRHEVIRKIGNADYSLFDYILGAGYFTIFIDIPIVQAFYDFGIWGIVYLFLLLIMPLFFLLKYNTSKAPVMIVLLFSLQYLFDQFYCGLPYWFFQYIPITLLSFFYYNSKSNLFLSTKNR